MAERHPTAIIAETIIETDGEHSLMVAEAIVQALAKAGLFIATTPAGLYGGHWQRSGHRIQRCDSSTGHTVLNVALCDDERTADLIMRALGTVRGQL